MGDALSDIKQYLRGDNPRFDAETMQKTTPPGEGSRLLTMQDTWFMDAFTAEGDKGVRVAGAGEIPKGNLGVKCYHGLNGAIELVLSHFVDQADDLILIDMTAGADAFSSTLFTKVDALALMVEPTKKSLAVYDQFVKHNKGFGIPLVVVANKIEDRDDLDYIESEIGTTPIILPYSQFVRKRERGTGADIAGAEPELKEALDAVYNAISSIDRDWDAMHARAVRMHIKSAQSWAGEEVLAHIDDKFSLKTAAGAL